MLNEATNNCRLVIELEGADADNGAVRLTDLYQFLQQLTQTLASVEKEINARDDAKVFYRVTGLSYASPVQVQLEAVTEYGRSDLASDVISRFAWEIQEVNHGREPEGIEAPTLTMMQGLGAGYKKHLTAIRVRAGAENEIPIPSDFEARIKKLLGNVYRTHGSFRGKLDAINLHGKDAKIYIYPIAGPTKIQCVFAKGKFPQIGELLNRTVDVRGVMLYRGASPHPFQIEAEEITPLRPQEELPTADQIIGSMPDVTGDSDVITYLKRLREDEAV